MQISFSSSPTFSIICTSSIIQEKALLGSFWINATVFRIIKKAEILCLPLSFFQSLSALKRDTFQDSKLAWGEANSSTWRFCTGLTWLVWVIVDKGQLSLIKDSTLPFLPWKNATPQLQTQGTLALLCLPAKYIPAYLRACSFQQYCGCLGLIQLGWLQLYIQSDSCACNS